MALDAKRILAQVKSLPRTLKVTAIVAAIDVIVILYSAFSLEDDVGDRQAEVAAMQSKLSGLQGKIQATRKQIDRLPELRKLYDLAVNNGSLIDQDRLKFVNLAQEAATEHHLSEFRFKLSPESSEPIKDTKFQLVSTVVSFTDGALRDNDVFAFWDDVLAKSQAHFQITKMTIERQPVEVSQVVSMIRKDGLQSVVSAHNPTQLMRAELQFTWRSMRRQPEAEKAAVTGSKAGPTEPAKTAEAAVAPQGGQP